MPNTQGSEQELVQSLIDFAWPEVVGRYTYDTLPPNSKAHVDKMLALIKSDRDAAKLEGRIVENKFWRHGLFNQDLSQPPYVNLEMFRRRTDELEAQLSKEPKS
jgi:hypothetical protein